MTYLTRHRTICAVLTELRELATLRGELDAIALCDEAITYAQSMSAALTKYKAQIPYTYKTHT